MFSSIYYNKLPHYNKFFSDYCKNSTMLSIKRLQENYKKKSYLITDLNTPPMKVNPYWFLFFLSLYSCLFFYKKQTICQSGKN